MTANLAPEITPELLLQGYASGIFPMADSADDPQIYWVDPKLRGVFPLDKFHVSRSLARRIRRKQYTVTVNKCFSDVVAACAYRPETWINNDLLALYQKLHSNQYAHSIEVMENDELVGGVFGIAMNGAFFGESMFSRRTDASKIALTYLMARLNYGGFTLFDTQFLTEHLESLGAVEISRNDYRARLTQAMDVRANFFKLQMDVQPSEILHLSSHTS